MTSEMDSSEEPLPEEFYNTLMDKGNVMNSWFLMRSPYPVLVILAVYLLIVLKLGKTFMATRPPYALLAVMRYYNLFQVLFNGLMVLKVIQHANVLPYIIRKSCSVQEDEDHEDLKQVYLLYGWFFLVSKIFDLFDTVFMVLRKKDSHVTFLHVYHHVAMVFFTWFTLSYIKSHHAILPGTANVIIHTIMYGYYFLTTFPNLKKHIWWKKHITKLQLVQFVFILLYISLLYYKGCPISRLFTYIWVFNVFVILVLFINFYIKEYMVRSGDTYDHKTHSKNN